MQYIASSGKVVHPVRDQRRKARLRQPAESGNAPPDIESLVIFSKWPVSSQFPTAKDTATPMNFRLILALLVLALLVVAGLIVYGYTRTPEQKVMEIEVTDEPAGN